MTKNFYDKQSILTCREDNITECQKFIEEKDKLIGKGYKCELKLIAHGQTYWLTHYDASDPDCDKEVKALFTPVSLCKNKI